MALFQESGANMLYAIQLYSGQIHTERMDLAPLLDAIESALKSGPRTIVIEGSSSDGPSTRADGNEGLASSRAMNVFLRLRSGLSERGLTYKVPYEGLHGFNRRNHARSIPCNWHQPSVVSVRTR